MKKFKDLKIGDKIWYCNSANHTKPIQVTFQSINKREHYIGDYFYTCYDIKVKETIFSYNSAHVNIITISGKNILNKSSYEFHYPKDSEMTPFDFDYYISTDKIEFI